ncbi:hypothetical protein T07_7733 [Trichinella nelsoni]|uniref:Uncharacterized protein n=1 Tax=Trichinella nelsoni TaxID=6336 RepID=A0A0V0RAI8_9BILA|nr:hypothetical protein T07_7733 [Trichinella nelsoni]
MLSLKQSHYNEYLFRIGLFKYSSVQWMEVNRLSHSRR